MPGSRRVKLIPRQNLLKIKIWDLQTPYNDALYSVSLDPSMAYPKIVEPNRDRQHFSDEAEKSNEENQKMSKQVRQRILGKHYG